MNTEAHHRWWKQTGCPHINRILHDDWNPIGFTMPEDEYATYAGTVGRMLREQDDVDEIAAFLGNARERMGLRRYEADDQLDTRIAGSLHAWYADQMRHSA